MTHGHQPKHAGEPRPTPPTSGSGVQPPHTAIDTARILSIYEDHIARLQEEAGSWRRATERLDAEKTLLSDRVDTLTNVMRNGRHCAMGGNADASTAEMLRFLAKHVPEFQLGAGAPTMADILDRACRLETADRMMRAALYPTEAMPSHVEEAEELFQSERISAALATYDFILGDADPTAPDREERVFDAMKAAIQRADHIARTRQTGER